MAGLSSSHFYLYNIIMEKWKKLNGFDCNYEISNYGRIRNSKSNKILKLKEIKVNSNYTAIRCNLRKNGSTVTPIVSRLVLQAFKPIENSDDYHADHIDCDPTNNNLSNLRWLKPEINCSNIHRDSYKTRDWYEKQIKAKDKLIKELQGELRSITFPRHASAQKI